jgi:tripartite-type tricarboxylate transporter receptor subunit TctC
LFAPAGTPKDIVEKLSREFVRILALPEVRQQLLAAGADPIGNSK